ncbi:MAG: DNA repair protein RecN [Phycisphaeraceae bacterium]|nr:DNA repair protein RecN [Phycisphaeraceae bacterium]
MLRELHITNLAVIDDLTLTLGEGLNCFTGQTGAGKSLILGAFELLLGLRNANAAELLRPGATEGRISGLFEVDDEELRQQVAELLDQGDDFDGQLLITRKLFASGRSSASVNGQPATAAMVRGVGELLVDIHGQHDHQYLLKPGNQLAILDRFADCQDLRRAYAQLHARRRELKQRQRDLAASSALRRQQLDLALFQADEIDAAALVEGEFAELQARHRVLSNSQKIAQDAGSVHAAMYDSEGSIIERLHAVHHVLESLAELDQQLKPTQEAVREATLSLQEAAYDLGGYLSRLDISPGEVAEVTERLNLINRLVAKYAGRAPADDPVAQVLAFRQQLQEQIDAIQADNQDEGSLQQQRDEVDTQWRKVGLELTKVRQAAAKKLAPQVDVELKELGMADAAFHIEFTPVVDDDETDDSASGFDLAEMMVRTNPGQPARPLRRIASGGEMSRIMLALKSILADSDRISVLVFDEIDANIGGRMGTVIGGKLRDLARQGQGKSRKPGRHQVLCITHLPQIAVYADRHLRVVKQVSGKGERKQTSTTVQALEGSQRIDELAEMLAGKQVTRTTRQQVQEMLAAAH